MPLGATPFSRVDAVREDSDQFSQEVRLTSKLNFPCQTKADDDWNKVTSSASIKWNYSENGMLYLSFFQGYKSGAFVSSDASVIWTSPGENWTVTAWGKNLNDEEYRLHTIISNIAGTVDVWAPPRTYGATVEYAF